MGEALDLAIVLTAKDAASKVIGDVGKKFDALGAAGRAAKVGLGIATAGLGLAVTAGVQFIQAAADEQVGMERMAQAFRNAGETDIPGLTASVESSIAAFEKMTAFSDGDMREALSMLTAETGNVDAAMNRLPIAMDFARGAGLDLATASKLLGKVTDENTKVLGRYGIQVEKGADATEVLRLVQERFAGQSEAFAKTAAGQWQIFQNQMDNLKEDLGAALLPIATRVFGELVRLVDAVRNGPMPGLIVRIGEVGAAFMTKLAPIWDIFANSAREAFDVAIRVVGSFGEAFDVITGRRTDAGGMLRSLIGDRPAEQTMAALAGVRETVKLVAEKVADAWAAIRDRLGPIFAKIGEWVDGLKAKWDDLPEPIKQYTADLAAAGVVTATAGPAFLGVGASIATIATGLVKVLTKIPIIGDLGVAFSGLALQAALAGGGITGWLAAIGSGIAGLLLSVPVLIAVIIGGLIFISQHLEDLRAIWDAVSYAAGAAWTRLGRVVGDVSAAVGGFLSMIGSAVGAFLSEWEATWEAFSARPAFWIGVLLGVAAAKLAQLVEFIRDFANDALLTLGRFAVDAGNVIVSWIEATRVAIWDFFTGLPALIGGWLGEVAVKLFGFKDEGVKAATTFTTDTGKTFADWFESLPGKFWDAAVNAVQGFIGGLGSMLGAVGSAIGGLFGGLGAGINVGLNVPGYAHGVDGIVTRPHLFMAGEAGPERLTVTPLGRGGGRGTGGVAGGFSIGQIVINGSVDSRDRVRELGLEFARQYRLAGGAA